ncbi:1-deoxy-D-xylulose-5-phosphate reductoisomerase [Georgenia sp. Z1344]|uniref:1-deoxy-D-xylulose-5-phosphate reductoisomerase n=1 Tax=Georgenia sp. Z1344 TaxID=3416706 RepID=UPI003CF835F2
MTTEVVLLGSTGSIGTQALDVVGRANADEPGRFVVRALAASGSRPELLAEQVAAHRPGVVGVADETNLADVREALASALGAGAALPEIVAGTDASTELAGMLGGPGRTADDDEPQSRRRRTAVSTATNRNLDESPEQSGPGDAYWEPPSAVVLNGITGSVGLRPTLAALASGATLALANKESLVAGGALVAQALTRPGQIIPVDSEHSAMAQALGGVRHEKGLTSPVVTGVSDVRRLVLTASGGPFRGRTRDQLADVTVEQALAHPTWAMGPVVTINSSTLMNKALELAEASLLFDVAPDDITVVVHPQSIVHSMIESVDGSTLAQASPPDMRLPIALGLSWPRRLPGVATPCAWDAATSWTFEPLDDATFPAVSLVRSALTASATHPAVVNAANEEAVAGFIAGRLPYLGILDVVERVLAEHDGVAQPVLADVEAAESSARARARELVAAA